MNLLSFLFNPMPNIKAFKWEATAITRTASDMYKSLGLIEPSDNPTGFQVLAVATSNWSRHWGAKLSSGWNAALPEEGLLGKIGGVVEAIIEHRYQLVPEFIAIAAGWGMLVAVMAFLASFVLGGFVSTAHAATSALSSSGNGDLAQSIFGQMYPFLGATTVLSNVLSNIALEICLMCSTLAGISTMWQAVWMFYDYTNDIDAAKQKHNLYTFVIRMGLGLGLLMPLNVGYSGCQVIVGSLSRWGSDHASVAWQRVFSNVATGVVQQGNLVTIPMVAETEVENVVRGTAAAEACAAQVNLDPSRNASEKVSIKPIPNGYSYDYSIYDPVQGWSMVRPGECGTVNFAGNGGASGDISIGFLNAQKNAWGSMQSAIQIQMQSFIQNKINCRDSTSSCQIMDPPLSGAASLVTNYRQALSTAIESNISNANSAALAQLNIQYSGYGWIGAGILGYSLSNVQTSAMDAAAAVPSVTRPRTGTAYSDVPDTGGIEASQMWLSQGIAQQTKSGQSLAALQSGAAGALNATMTSYTSKIWDALVQINQAAPLSSISTVGYVTYGTGMGVWGLAATSEAVVDNGLFGIAAKVTSMKGVVDVIAGPVKSFAAGMIAIGFVLAYIVPALPFIRFYFAVIGWVIECFNCVTLIPLVIVMLVSSENGGFLGPIMPALLNVFVLIFRPLLILAGFIIGLIVISIGVMLLNVIMLPVAQSILASPISSMLGYVAFAFIYAVMVYTLVNVATRTPETIALAACHMVGAAGTPEQDHGGALTGILAGVSARLFSGAGRGGRQKSDRGDGGGGMRAQSSR